MQRAGWHRIRAQDKQENDKGGHRTRDKSKSKRHVTAVTKSHHMSCHAHHKSRHHKSRHISTRATSQQVQESHHSKSHHRIEHQRSAIGAPKAQRPMASAACYPPNVVGASRRWASSEERVGDVSRRRRRERRRVRWRVRWR